MKLCSISRFALFAGLPVWVCLAVSSPAFAQSNSPDAALIPPTHHIDDNSTVGIRARGFLLTPGISVTSVYDDNVFLTKVNPVSDVMLNIKAAVGAQSNWNRHQLYFAAMSDKGTYNRYVRKNYTNYGAIVSGQYDIAKETYLTVDVARRKRDVGRGSIDDQDGLTSIDYETNTQNISFTRALSYIRLKLFGKNEKTEVVSGFDQMVTGDFIKKQDNSFGGTLSFEYLPHNDIFLTTAYTNIEIDLIGGTERQIDKRDVQLGWNFDTNSLYSGRVYIGRLYRDYSDAESAKSMYYGGAFNWAVTPLTTVSFLLNRSYAEGTVSGRESVITTAKKIQLHHSLTTRLSGDVSGGFSDNDYSSSISASNVNNRQYLGNAGVNYQFSENANLRMGYDYRVRKSEVSTSNYKDNRISMSFSYMY